VIRLSLTTEDPEGDCNERLSDDFVERTYGTRPRCEQIQTENEDGEPDVESLEFASVEVQDDSATAAFTARGGEAGEVEGALEMVREEDDWRIDGMSVPLLRSLVELGVESTENLPAGGVECATRKLRAIPDSEFRDFAYKLLGQRPEGRRRTLELFAACEGEGGSLLRQAFEEGLVESLREQNWSQEQIDCVIDGTRERVSDDRLLELLSGENPDAATAQAIGPAVDACR